MDRSWFLNVSRRKWLPTMQSSKAHTSKFCKHLFSSCILLPQAISTTDDYSHIDYWKTFSYVLIHKINITEKCTELLRKVKANFWCFFARTAEQFQTKSQLWLCKINKQHTHTHSSIGEKKKSSKLGRFWYRNRHTRWKFQTIWKYHRLSTKKGKIFSHSARETFRTLPCAVNVTLLNSILSISSNASLMCRLFCFCCCYCCLYPI